MKNLFNVIVIVLALVVAYLIFELWFGNPDNFMDEAKRQPKQGAILGMIYTGGPIVAILISLIIIAVTFSVERTLSINKARGKGNINEFVKRVTDLLVAGKTKEALAECENQRGSLANIIRGAITRFNEVESDTELDKEKKMSEVQRAIDEAINLETPLLERNLVILSTVSSVSTMFGLLGTTIGMIRAFAAFGETGTVDATQLAVGISEALYNTAGGLGAAIISIIAFNFFSTKVDAYVYMIDEAVLNVTQILTVRVNK